MLGSFSKSFVRSELNEMSSQRIRSSLERGVYLKNCVIAFPYAFKTYTSSSTLLKAIGLYLVLALGRQCFGEMVMTWIIGSRINESV